MEPTCQLQALQRSRQTKRSRPRTDPVTWRPRRVAARTSPASRPDEVRGESVRWLSVSPRTATRGLPRPPEARPRETPIPGRWCQERAAGRRLSARTAFTSAWISSIVMGGSLAAWTSSIWRSSWPRCHRRRLSRKIASTVAGASRPASSTSLANGSGRWMVSGVMVFSPTVVGTAIREGGRRSSPPKPTSRAGHRLSVACHPAIRIRRQPCPEW